MAGKLAKASGSIEADYLNGEVVLLPANDAYSPIRIPADMVTIEGVYVGLVRETAA